MLGVAPISESTIRYLLEVQDGVGPAHCPEHSRLLAAGAVDGLATGFDDAGADEQMLRTQFGLAHALGVLVKVSASMRTSSDNSTSDRLMTERGHQFFNFALIQECVLMDDHPAFLLGLVAGKQLAG